MKTATADIPNEIQIGALRLVRVGNHMVSVRNEETGDVVVMREWEVEEALLLMVDCR